MAFSFDEVNDYITLADNAALDFPDADWTLAFWMKVPDLTGTGQPRILAWGAGGASPSFKIMIGEDSSPQPGFMQLNLEDSDGDVLNVNTADGVITTGTWLYIICGRTGDTAKVYVDNVEKGSSTNASYDSTLVSGTFFIGATSALDATLFYGGELAELAMWNTFLSADQRAALANGYAPSNFPESLAWYMPMIREYQEIMVPLTVTNNGTTVVSHPRMIYPSTSKIVPIAGIIKDFSDVGAEGSESFVVNVTVPKAFSDVGAEGSESFDISKSKELSDAGAEGAESFAISKTRAFSDAGAEGSEIFLKNVFITPTYLKNKFEAITIKILDS